MSTQTATLGKNRTGIATSMEAAESMIAGTNEFPPDSAGDERRISDVRELFAKEAEPLGTVPPPPSLKGMATTALNALKGARPTQFVDKLGERLGFERTGVRLYQALISKYATFGGFPGGPTLADLEQNMREEHQHLRLLTEVLTKLGADPTVLTPSADLHATMTKGVLEVVVDPRTSFAQCLEALLLAELADNDCWEALIAMARDAGEESVVDSFEEALAEEADHLEDVRAWLAAAQNRKEE
jgi:ferritin-like metal-binding protein YciE